MIECSCMMRSFVVIVLYRCIIEVQCIEINFSDCSYEFIVLAALISAAIPTVKFFLSYDCIIYASQTQLMRRNQEKLESSFFHRGLGHLISDHCLHRINISKDRKNENLPYCIPSTLHLVGHFILNKNVFFEEPP